MKMRVRDGMAGYLDSVDKSEREYHVIQILSESGVCLFEIKQEDKTIEVRSTESLVLEPTASNVVKISRGEYKEN